MRIICPSCQAVYDVPDAILAGAPRPVRCARCRTEWTPPPAPPPAAAVADARAAPPAGAPPPDAAMHAAMHGAMHGATDAAMDGAADAATQGAWAPPDEPPPPPAGRTEPRLTALRPRGEPRLPMPPGGTAGPPADVGDEYEEAPPTPRSGAGAAILWVLTLAVLAAAAWSAVHWRAEVMAAWPPSERLYGLLGLR